MNKKKTILISVAVIVAIMIVIVAMLPISELMSWPKDEGQDVVVVIPEGATIDEIGDILISNGIVESKFAFKVKVRSFAGANDLKFGKYKLNTGMTIPEVLEVLVKGDSLMNKINITIPEGFSAEKIAALAEEKGVCTKEEFLNSLKNDTFNYDFISQIPDNPDVKYKLQGYLFPSTYEIDDKTTANSFINQMLTAYRDNVTPVLKGNDRFSAHEIMILASVVEREAKLDDERSKIAGVFINRMDNNMPLQVDATVIYAQSDGMYDMDVVLFSDLEVDSKYNTYKYPGIPAGPICSPGLESIVACMNPEVHDYLYYHTDEVKKDGSHIFTQSYESHVNTQ